MNNIDILEEKEKKAIENLRMKSISCIVLKSELITALNLLETLIAENKELKEENLHWKGQYHLLSRKIDVIPKSKVEEKLEIIIKQNIINCYLLEALILQSGISERNFKKLMKDAGKEANRCYEETVRELLDERNNTDE